MTAPIIILHRRNRTTDLETLPPGCWIEVDVDYLDGMACISHDPPTREELPDPLSVFVLRAIEKGVKGFIFDCKREGVEKAIDALVDRYTIVDYFYLNEMEIQADRYLAKNAAHRTASRVWRYRPARELIRYVEEMRAAKQAAPNWAWIDCWQRELGADINKPFLAINQADAHRLQRLGVKLCVCSPELYGHDYLREYSQTELNIFYKGVISYRHLLMQTGVAPDAVCTKFPHLWEKNIDELLKA